MRGLNFSFFIVRYVFFAFFTISNAIICSVAVWNHSLVHSEQASQVGDYLIFLGAFSLVSIFTLIFVELLRIDPFTTRVWFECGWVSLFWVLELAGAAAVAAIEPDLMCFHQVAPENALCTSGRVLLAFTWICTIILLIYLVSLVVLTVSQHHRDPTVWSQSVRYLLTKVVSRLASVPNSPSTPWPIKRAPVEIYTPQPVRTHPPPSYHRGLSSEYEIEPFRPTFAVPEQMDIPISPTLLEATPHLPLPPAQPAPVLVKPVPKRPLPSTGVRHWDNARNSALDQVGAPSSLPSSIVYAVPNSLSAPAPVLNQSSSLPSPSPLGDWPRHDILQQPVKPLSRRKPPPSAFEFPKRHGVGTGSSEQLYVSEPLASDPSVQPRARRPSGPRMRVPSGESTHRPAPLDLSGISNHD